MQFLYVVKPLLSRIFCQKRLRVNFRSVISTLCCGKFTLALTYFGKTFRESNSFTNEIIKGLIWRNNFLVFHFSTHCKSKRFRDRGTVFNFESTLYCSSWMKINFYLLKSFLLDIKSFSLTTFHYLSITHLQNKSPTNGN